MYSGKVEICGINTSKIKVLSQSENDELLKLAHEGDSDAREKLINGNLKLILSVIKKFSSRGENSDDLFQVGCVGLIKAVDNFDITMNVRFSTYAVPMIIGEIRRFLRDSSPVQVSRSVRELAYKAFKAKDSLTAEHGRDPTYDEIAGKLGVTRRQLYFALEAISDPISLFEPVYTDGNDSVAVMDQISDTENHDSAWLEQIALSDAVKKLDEREKNILYLRYFGCKTQMEVASMIEISQAQVSRIEKTALGKIKRML